MTPFRIAKPRFLLYFALEGGLIFAVLYGLALLTARLAASQEPDPVLLALPAGALFSAVLLATQWSNPGDQASIVRELVLFQHLHAGMGDQQLDQVVIPRTYLPTQLQQGAHIFALQQATGGRDRSRRRAGRQGGSARRRRLGRPRINWATPRKGGDENGLVHSFTLIIAFHARKNPPMMKGTGVPHADPHRGLHGCSGCSSSPSPSVSSSLPSSSRARGVARRRRLVSSRFRVMPTTIEDTSLLRPSAMACGAMITTSAATMVSNVSFVDVMCALIENASCWGGGVSVEREKRKGPIK